MNSRDFRKELEKIKRSKQAMAVFILLFVSVIFWTVITLVSSQTSSSIDTELQALAKPLRPNLDLEILDSIEQKRYLSPQELASFTIYTLITRTDNRQQVIAPIGTSQDDLPQPSPSLIPSPSPASSPTASPSAQIETSPTPTASPAPTASPQPVP